MEDMADLRAMLFKPPPNIGNPDVFSLMAALYYMLDNHSQLQYTAYRLTLDNFTVQDFYMTNSNGGILKVEDILSDLATL